MKRIWGCALLAAVCAWPAQGQDFGKDFGLKNIKTVDFLDLVDPIITEGEVAIYKNLPSTDARDYFRAIFWHKRDPDPSTVSNSYKLRFYERRSEADIRFGEGDKPGSLTDRGRVYTLLGEPDDVVQNELPRASAWRALEEVWTYGEPKLSFRFVYDGRSPVYRMEDKGKAERAMEEVRDAQVLDRAEPYALRSLPLTLPNLGFSKDIENLASDDKNELRHRVSYAFFKGNLNRTQMMISLTLFDASSRGMEVNLTAYDPYDVKVLDFKKKIEPRNGVQENFFVAIEPDQYSMVLRLRDRDGRESINRELTDVPRIGGGGLSASSLLIGDQPRRIPLQGFLEPKMFVFGRDYFPVSHDFSGARVERLYLMQQFYDYPGTPRPAFFVDDNPAQARIEAVVEEGDSVRVLASISAAPLKDGGAHRIRSVYEDSVGNLVSSQAIWRTGGGGEPAESELLTAAAETGPVRMVHPSSDDASKLERVVAAADDGVVIRRMHVFLNGRLFLERDKAPWEVYFPKDSFSVSGQNQVAMILDTDRGLYKVERLLKPLRVDERIKTRVVQIFFNAFDQNLKFLSDIDLDALSVEVDGAAYQPREVAKLDEPITYCFLVDTSFSMKESFGGNIGALRLFIQSMRPEDRGFFVAFNNNYTQFLNPTQSKAVLLAAAASLNLERPNPKFADQIYAENETFLYDSVIASVHSLLQYPGRKVIVVVSDGIGIEGEYQRNGMLSYARENDVVVYSLWVDNNPQLSDDESQFLQKEMTKAEKVFRAIGLSRFFAKKDARKNRIGMKVRKASITEGLLKMLSEESGGFHYRVFKTDRALIREYVGDIETAVQTQFVMSLNLPIAAKKQNVAIYSAQPNVSIRNKSEIMVNKSNPLVE